MAQTKPKAAQFYGVSGNGTAGQVLISDGNGGMSWGANTEQFTVSWATPTGQSLTYTQPNPQSSTGSSGSSFPTTTFTATKSGEEISGTATIAGLPTGITASQSLSGTGVDNILTVTLTGIFPGSDSLNTALTLSGLTVQVPLTVEYLVVAGGGGGGDGSGGGAGGAGGYRTNYGGTAIAINSATNYLVTVGGGGAGGVGTSTNGSNGIASVFHTITSAGGGGGRGEGPGSLPNSGGSGGGGSFNSPRNGGSGNTPSTTPSQGNSGGAGGTSNPDYTGGGGGGAGGVGASAASAGAGVAGNGGVGASNSITGTAVFYAGGGGGGSQNSGSAGTPGTGGSGGGGTGLYYGGPGAGASNNGTPNTGGGAGGGAFGATIPSGGSGIVILRYSSSYTISGLSGSTTTVGSERVTTFISGTGNIQFN